MVHVIQARRDLAFDDLHVDEISERFRAAEVWIEAAIESLQTAILIRNTERWTYTVAAGFSLRSTSTPTGLPSDQLAEIVSEMDDSPPSLYLFKMGDEPWVEDTAFRELSSRFHPRLNLPVRSFLREWFDENDGEFRRSFWLVG
jgi:hypothetical protein